MTPVDHNREMLRSCLDNLACAARDVSLESAVTSVRRARYRELSHAAFWVDVYDDPEIASIWKSLRAWAKHYRVHGIPIYSSKVRTEIDLCREQLIALTAAIRYERRREPAARQ